MGFVKINSYTRVLNDGTKTIEERKKLINQSSLSKSTNYLKEKKNRNLEEQRKLYEEFVDEVFEDRKFICRKEFHQLICAKFNSNTTFYRTRMIKCGLITEKSQVIKLSTLIKSTL